MKFAVNALGDAPIEREEDEQPEDIGLTAEHATFPGLVHTAVKITRMQEDVFVQGESRTTAQMPCSRCLAPVDIPLDGRFEVLFVPRERADAEGPERREQHWGDQRVSFYAENTIDLADEVAHTLRLELPMRPLCKEDCAGLCPSCGKDLNEGPCGCETEDDEDVWAPLRKLVEGDRDESSET